ncbi:MAG: ROK family protein [Planifilum fimeticola]
MERALGVDIGGTKVAAGLVSAAGECLHYTELPSVPGDGDEMFRQVMKAIRGVMSAAGVSPAGLRGIGVGVPGKVDREKGLAVMQNNLPWRDFPLADRIREEISVPVVLDNDVCMAAHGEWMKRGGSVKETFVYITISTGIACCTIHRGRILRGAGFSGEIGLAVFSPDGGRLEKKAAGPAIGRLAGGEGPEPSRRVMDSFREADPRAVAAMNGVIEEWARGLYAIICLLDPHRLVLGGGVIHRNPFLLDEIRRRLESLIIPEQRPSLNRLSLTALGERAGCIGAGLRVLREETVSS